MEIEFKLLIAPDDVPALLAHPLLALYASAPPRRMSLRNTYFDTPDNYLQAHDCGLRVRKYGRELIQTLKGGGAVASGLHSRHEWESPLTRPVPDLDVLQTLIGGGHWRKLLDHPPLRDQLAPVFTTDFERTAWQLRSKNGDRVELALDQGHIRRGKASVAISEVELELKSGDPACLYELALALLATLPLRLGNASKAERGYRLMTPHAAQPVRAQALTLSGRMPAFDALGRIVGNCLQQIQGNEEALVAGADPEAVHQMRVGVRRLRSALAVVKDDAPLPAGLDAELRWLWGILGAARDWDVLSSDTLPAVRAAFPEREPLVALARASAGKAVRLRAQAAQAVTSPRYAALLLTLGRWLHDSEQALSQPLSDLAGDSLRHYQKKLRRRTRQVRDTDAQSRHRMRIAAKGLRYALEFFRSLYRSRQVKPYIAELSRLQDELGQLNDAAVAEHLLGELAAASADLAAPAGFVSGYLAGGTRHRAGALRRHSRQLERIALTP